MGPARKRLALKAAPTISPWLCLACPLIHPSMNDSFQQPLLHSSHSVYPALSSKCPTTLPLSRCSSPVVSSVSVPLGNALHDLWLGKHLTKCIPFQIQDYILLFQYLGASEQPWPLRQQVKLAKHTPPSKKSTGQGCYRNPMKGTTPKAKQVKSPRFSLFLYTAGYVSKPLDIKRRLPPAVRIEISWTKECTNLLCPNMNLKACICNRFHEIAPGAISIIHLMDMRHFD